MCILMFLIVWVGVCQQIYDDKLITNKLMVYVISVRTAANQRQPQQAGGARPGAGRPPAQLANNQNSGSGDIYNAGRDSDQTDELTLQVMAPILTHTGTVLSWFIDLLHALNTTFASS